MIRGARVHNLKNINVQIPHNALTVITGVSGSGKSSLAFDTIYAEGQRRYVESLSAYARQFLERIEKPDVDSVDGIAPAIAIRQKNTTRNPRSTVGTSTEIYDYLRLLFARIGVTHCPQCGREVRRDTVDQVANQILAWGERTRLYLLFPLQVGTVPGLAGQKSKRTSAKARKAAEEAAAQQAQEMLRSKLFDLRKRGFNRLYQEGKIFEFSSPESLLDVDFKRPVYLLIDRLVLAADSRSRLVDGLEIAFRETGEAWVVIVPQDEGVLQTHRFVQRFECKECGIRCEDPEPRLFSFNNPFGACPRCQGFGNTIDFDLDLVIPDKNKTLAEGAVEPWTKPKYRSLGTDLRRFAKECGIPMDVAWAELEQEQRQLVLEGAGGFPGVQGFFAYLERKKYKLHVRVFLSRYRGYATCPDCKGQRLRPEARNVRIAGKNICELCSMTVEDGYAFVQQLELGAEQAQIAGRILQELRDRLRFLMEVGLEYLSLDRLSSTLSGGEAQRIQLASALASRMTGALYVLDEPSIGLHSRDTSRLIRILHELRDLGNTIVVVEHDPETMHASDFVLDLGPGAGEHGGRLVAQGTYDEILHAPHSLTGRYLSGELKVQLPPSVRPKQVQSIEVKGARVHNLKNIDVSFPLGRLVVVTGVSGSGKSTLVHDVLYRSLAMQLGILTNAGVAHDWDKVEGAHQLRDVVLVDQSPIGRTPRSNPVTYIKTFDAIREAFAATPEAQKRGFNAGHFSFNIPGGRCETCQGDGTVVVEMQFLADVELVCEDCKGTRYKQEILDIRYKGKNIHEVLNLTVREALQFFSGSPKITDRLRLLDEVGLAYLRLGQSATTLSGGEAQRLKLAAHLHPKRESADAGQKNQEGNGRSKQLNRTLYIFDEPTTGLHFDDVGKLLFAFRHLLDIGASIIVIEHNLDVIKSADWIIDLGPEGGIKGGEVVVAGTPKDVTRNKKSHTGRWLSGIISSSSSQENGRKSKT